MSHSMLTGTEETTAQVRTELKYSTSICNQYEWKTRSIIREVCAERISMR